MPQDPHGAVPEQRSLDLEEMWKALLACDWNSLAVIPTDSGVSVVEVLKAYHAATAGMAPPVRLIDARGVEVSDGKRLAQEMAATVSGTSRAVVVVDPLIHSLSGVHLVQGVHAVLLVVRVGGMDLDSLTSTVAIVGPERIVGSVTAPMAG